MRTIRLRRLTLLLAIATLAAPATAHAGGGLPVGDVPDCGPVTPRPCIVSLTFDGGPRPTGYGVFFIANGINASWLVDDPAPAGLRRLTLDLGDRAPLNVLGWPAQGLAVTRTRTGATWQATFTWLPATVAWKLDAGFSCEAVTDPPALAHCGDLTTRATIGGLKDQVVVRLGDPGAPVPDGFSERVEATNAQSTGIPLYYGDTRTFAWGIANPHLRADGAPATGFADLFLSDRSIRDDWGVDPADLTTAMLEVTRQDGTRTPAPVDASIARVDGGVLVHLGSLSFSAPVVRVRRTDATGGRPLPRLRRPGPPRSLTARRTSPTRATLRFRAPVGGALRYVARCIVGSASARGAAARSPLVVRGLVAGRAYRCTVRSYGRAGLGGTASVRVRAA